MLARQAATHAWGAFVLLPPDQQLGLKVARDLSAGAPWRGVHSCSLSRGF